MKIVESIRFPLRVVAIGGGTGLPVVLRGMKSLLFPEGTDDPGRLVAVVTVTDEGGSSGRLRDELGMLPPGDVRNCLVALSHNEPLMSRLFQTRYRCGGVLDGHSVGNLILAGLAQEENGFLGAVELASEVLNIQGRVYPSTHVHTRLVAGLRDGRHVIGEAALIAAGGIVDSLKIEPSDPPATNGVVEAIDKADIVVLGPGSLYTSIIPNILIPDVSEALRRTKAFRVLVVNAMTEVGETGQFSAADHVRAVHRHAGEGVLDAALLACDEIPVRVQIRYQAEGAEPVNSEDDEIDALVPNVFRKKMLKTTPKVRHDPILTAGSVLTSYASWRNERREGVSGDSRAAKKKDSERDERDTPRLREGRQ